MYRICFAGLSLFALSIFAAPAKSHQSGPVATTVVTTVGAVRTVGANVAGRMEARQAHRQQRPWRQRWRARAAGYGSAGYAVHSYGSAGYSSHSYGSHGAATKTIKTEVTHEVAEGCPAGGCP